MEVRRITSQGPDTLAEFYTEILRTRTREPERWLPRCMLDLLAELAAGGPEPVVWGLTSVCNLSLHAADDWQSPTLVSVAPTSAGTWHISCALPADRRPWPDAMITGYTEQLAEAVRRVRLGLQWAGLLPGAAKAEPSAAADPAAFVVSNPEHPARRGC